ncbi:MULTISPECIES: thioredoxin [Mycobacteriaceae]|jgi:thioredoxin 2|uniref:Thioredoxin n=1 Tax=Mycolicibacterium austroafricanum TaxID=39687 RepID=A0ABT8H8X0_MYCAO|nr:MULTISPECIES: thioredoxin [Mycobacteriaceae]MDN4517209.1 thioredoxin [Mycolicibacterium austroafricanum]
MSTNQTSQTSTEHGASVIRCPQCGKSNRVRPTPRGTPRCGSCHQPLPWLVAASAATFDAELQASVPVLVDLWAPWCGPCRAVAPVLEQLARQRAGHLKVVKLNVDEAAAPAARYHVQGIPLLVLHRDGREVARLAGAVPLAQLQTWLDSQLGRAHQ